MGYSRSIVRFLVVSFSCLSREGFFFPVFFEAVDLGHDPAALRAAVEYPGMLPPAERAGVQRVSLHDFPGIFSPPPDLEPGSRLLLAFPVPRIQGTWTFT